MLALYFVILNEVKNLEGSVAVDGSASLEILRYTQDDIERDCHEPNGSRNDAVECHSKRYPLSF